MMPILRSIVLAAILTATIVPAARADFSADSLALIGTWEWTKSWGGMVAVDEVPLYGRIRVLSFLTDGRFTYVQHDSAQVDTMSRGTYVVHPVSDRVQGAGRPAFWVEFIPK